MSIAIKYLYVLLHNYPVYAGHSVSLLAHAVHIPEGII
jgi:hypothetical protein